ncbi:CU044_2847 family protein [Streptomyces sp. T-3]|nr:CU044_2847 family protein [Streptomyces sp. T-3]
MDGLIEFKTADGGSVVIAAADDDDGGPELISRANGPDQARRTFESSLEGVRAAAESALRVFKGGQLKPDTVELEFGVKLTAEAGAVIAKTAVEGHLTVKLSWSPGSKADEPAAGEPAAGEPAAPEADPAP